MKTTRGSLIVIGGLWALGWLQTGSAQAADGCRPPTRPIAKIVSAQGMVQLNGSPAQLDQIVCEDDSIRVGARSRAAIVLLDTEAIVRIDQNSELRVLAVVGEERSLLDLLTGVIQLFSRTPRDLEVQTPYVNAAVEGTEFLIRVDAAGTFVSVFAGLVRATNASGSLSLTSNQSAVALPGKSPTLQIVVRPRDAVRWALYYPVVLPGVSMDARRDLPPALRDTHESLLRGDLTQAFDHLTRISEADRNEEFHVYRAGLLLAVGQVEEARGDIDQALRIAPANSDAIALQSIIAVAQDEKDSALALARRAEAQDPDSATALIALSYAQQSHFDLPGALDSLQRATEHDPRNALAWARVAELWLSMGELDKALEAAERAETLESDLARTQTVLGFAYLTQFRTQRAKQAFERAIALDQADPLPRLGLGLAKIRDGALESGRKQIEIAASLDPGNALIRSYMGKAYYEERRDKLAATEYAIAKELDPLDPTPFFYDAIRKQTINRPVGALHDLQRSIELNDNRAVYRSRLLLDQDLAARSASLGRIYQDLGFEQIALVEGWRSVNTDPSNFSGHRFLADTYSALPRHATARVSELLQSQLLQPLNITPVQPALGEADLFIAERSGPGDPSFNEFNPLFERNRFALQASVVAGGNDTVGDEVVQSGLWNRFSYSLGQLYYESDGFRENNDQKREIYNVFGQVALSHKTSIQAGFRYTTVDKGDLELRFDPSNFTPTLRQNQDVYVVRAGLHHAFTPRSDLIASFFYRKIDSELDIPPTVTADGEERSFLGEAQYLFHSERLNVVIGVGHFDAKQDDLFEFVIPIPGPPFLMPVSMAVTDDPRHTNLYLYSQIRLPFNVELTLGASGDFFKNMNIDRDQFNPKAGLTWSPLPSTTLRAAVFRTLQRPTFLRESTTPTIEPTQVAGFNQVFLGPIGEEAWRYGVGLDNKFSDDLYAGGEVSKRDLDTPILTPTLVRADWDEELARAYLYWTPLSSVALSVEYLYERFKREAPFGEEAIKKLRTHRVPLGIRYFHPIGISARFKATYVDQDGDFAVPLMPGPGTAIVSDDDRFWVLDASLSYRLPRRYGLLSVEVKNLTDANFHFQDTDPGNPRIVPDRLVLFRFTGAL